MVLSLKTWESRSSPGLPRAVSNFFVAFLAFGLFERAIVALPRIASSAALLRYRSLSYLSAARAPRALIENTCSIERVPLFHELVSPEFCFGKRLAATTRTAARRNPAVAGTSVVTTARRVIEPRALARVTSAPWARICTIAAGGAHAAVAPAHWDGQVELAHQRLVADRPADIGTERQSDLSGSCSHHRFLGGFLTYYSQLRSLSKRSGAAARHWRR